MKKIYLLMFALLCVVILSSCKEESEDNNTREITYIITWKNDNGEVLGETKVLQGQKPEYNENPIKDSTAEYSYEFNGWMPEIVEANSDATYTATYTETLRTYEITWNVDGKISTTTAKYGEVPKYNGTPTKEPTSFATYEFDGWDKEIAAISGNETYTAIFTEILNKYTVTWVNYDGAILETDLDIEYGTTPTFDGKTPIKEGIDTTYIFTGWNPMVEKVTGDATYTATYTEIKNEDMIPGIIPTLTADQKSILYGFYPQTYVSDETLIQTLNTLLPTNVNGWYLYEGIYYAKEIANVFKDANYTFDNGTAIVSGNTYWFKCEPIKWNILKNENGTYSLLSNVLLDAYSYHSTYTNRTEDGKKIYSNNYKYSDIRKWLNEEFYNVAFALNDKFITELFIDNSTITTESSDNSYVCENTKDKIYLLSYQDYFNVEYGFNNGNDTLSSSRQCKTTDYTRIKGVWYNNGDKNPSLKYYSSYWTRTPSSQYYYCAWNVNSGGHLSEYAVDGNTHGVRPAITITFTLINN